MKPRFTDSQLWTLRNQIPIEQLIETQLRIPVKRDNNRLRFSCPLCHQYDTSILYPKNLARCFSCQKNFNTIELTMQWAKLDFVKSVLWLQTCLQTPNTHPINARKDQGGPKRHSFTHISEIIPKILPQIKPTVSKSHHLEPTIVKRVDQMEKKIDTLDHKLDQLLKMLGSARI